jgi:hypothetical protein
VRFHYVLVDYRCRVLGGALMSATDVTEARWATWSELTGHGALAIRPFTLSVIRKALDQVSKGTAGESEIVTREAGMRETGMPDRAVADSMHPAKREEPFP